MLTKLISLNPALSYCGIAHLALFICFLLLAQVDHRQLMGINLWIKPMKFALSIGLYVLTWPFFLQYLPYTQTINTFTLVTVIALSFEMLCIAGQAARGEMSHYNSKGGFNSIVFAAMGIAILLQTLFAAYMGMLYFTISAINLSSSLLWGIRLGILISCVFALQGGVMAARLSHSVGAPDGSPGLPFVNWSKTAGDLRIAHFLGLHALQLIPLFAFYASRNSAAATIAFAAGYTLFTSVLLVRALAGMPLIH